VGGEADHIYQGAQELLVILGIALVLFEGSKHLDLTKLLGKAHW